MLIYVHGFNTTFSGALKRAAQVSMAMGYCGPVLAFSWPSAGSLSPAQYFMDGEQAALSSQSFKKLLLVLAKSVRRPCQCFLSLGMTCLGLPLRQISFHGHGTTALC